MVALNPHFQWTARRMLKRGAALFLVGPFLLILLPFMTLGDWLTRLYYRLRWSR